MHLFLRWHDHSPMRSSDIKSSKHRRYKNNQRWYIEDALLIEIRCRWLCNRRRNVSIQFNHQLTVPMKNLADRWNKKKKKQKLLALICSGKHSMKRKLDLNNQESSRPSAVPELIQVEWEILGSPSLNWNNGLYKRNSNRFERGSKSGHLRCWSRMSPFVPQSWCLESEWCSFRSLRIVLKRRSDSRRARRVLQLRTRSAEHRFDRLWGESQIAFDVELMLICRDQLHVHILGNFWVEVCCTSCGRRHRPCFRSGSASRSSWLQDFTRFSQ